MKTTQSNPRSIALLIGLLTLSGLTAPAADLLLYDASLGTLPTAQGFTDGSTEGGGSPTVSGGALHQPGNDTLGGYQFWYAYATNPPVAFSTNTYTVELTMRVLYAVDFPPAVDPDDTGRGFQFAAIDAAGYVFTVNVGTNSVTLVGNCAYTNVAFNSADGFHTYRVTFSTNTVALFLDDALSVSTPITGAPLHPDQYANYVYFGDGS